jgi:hypothetical protein
MGATSTKEQFASIVEKLTSVNIDPSDHDFWDDLWKSSLTSEEIFDVISPADVRKMIAVGSSICVIK